MTTPYQRKNNDSVSDDVVWHNSTVTHQDRVAQKGQKPVILWFTGLSGSGKSTVANAVESKLLQIGNHSYLLDGDNVRHGLNKDLGFSDTDRVENIRRIGEVAKLFVDAGNIVLTAFISPFLSDRQQVRELVTEGEFLEVFVDTPLDVCEARDPKGLYKKARAGEIKHFTGIDSEYQAPVNPEIHLHTAELSIEACADFVVTELEKRGYLQLGEHA
ncbi:adenylyl-sulfate kinase [Vibrio sp. 10N.261.46.E12]|uniref:adenylyl-sulfate kinase n=1 Tax=unclassified Vibrio TaxID=2614977 RepID=UPI00097753CC|nr:MULTISPECIES: adenylyl-sulfate kinase [unclassified Vibrio]OMO32547.1 adenylyl-sulfate kinase [Vibrio sp. 10N.261.45.E1]PMJ26025.1 adenylyl-sulfate kinase [Vibrio sp. 10N.286.45.B6]PML89662.1 adenylyl-sulfate kinase [Vibrio sp. 10N.261.49.E11]PMM69670.1 adenylyl-sulfate kinase [Vibrio sp. 10N.261.46.F12]PMM90732.1 adenylyl-sulfate kinase [Vibrio sp. 10N.261.46.E8]